MPRTENLWWLFLFVQHELWWAITFSFLQTSENFFHLIWDLAQLQKIKRFFIFVFMLLTVKILSKQRRASVPASEFLSWLLRLFFRH